jgi:pyruvate dehydrogenase E1 component alpha subunit
MMARATIKTRKKKSTASRSGQAKDAAKAARATKVKTKARVEKPKESRDELLGLFESMLLIRRFEEKAGQLYGQGEIAGFCHLYIGQEAVRPRIRCLRPIAIMATCWPAAWTPRA